MEIIYEAKESFTVLKPISEAVTALEAGLRNAGYKPHTTGSSVMVSTGSDRTLRFWGTSIPWGRSNVPVGMTASFTPTPEGTRIEVHAHDKLGWYFDVKTNQIIREEALRKIGALVSVTRQALQP